MPPRPAVRSTPGEVGQSAVPLPAVLQVITDTDRRGAQIFATELHGSLGARGVPMRTVALASGREGGLDWPVLGRRSLGIRTLAGLRRAAVSADVVVAQGSRTLPASALATLGRTVPFVYRSIGEIDRWASTPGRRVRVQAFLRRSDRVVALWPGAAATIVRHFDIPADRVAVIPRGVPAGDYPPVTVEERLAARQRLGQGARDPVVAYIGSLTPEKRVQDAVRAVAGLPDVRLLVAGTGSLRARLEDLARDAAPGRVRFLGAVTDVRPVLAAADAVVLPSRTEGISGVPIEAGLRGLPSVVTDVGGMSDVVVHGRTGVLVEPGNVGELREGLTTVLRSPQELGAAAREHCLQRFSMEVVADAWLALLRDYGR